ncbi:MAG: ethylbenzene dehydrogenase, partial [Candidatus Eisenbacteria bacterium]|nr:ethylbenzene dehydrogenase [Candidatus Eisenbacteria bacterium]
TLSNGAVIDPVADSGYHRDGSKMPPSIYTRPPSGDRADIDAVGVFSGGWTLEFKRALTTGSSGLDVQFNDLGAMYPMGVAVFDNSQIAHAVANLPVMLAFERQ